MANETPTPPKVSDDTQKFWLAIVFLFFCFAGIVTLAFVLLNEDQGTKLDTAKSIFNAVLPLLGAWVGAILAYYFGAKQVEAIQKQQTKALDLIQKQAEANNAVIQNLQEVIMAQMQKIESLTKTK